MSDTFSPASAADEVTATAHEWDRAMVTNEADAIGRYMSDDWAIIGSDGRIIDRDRFLFVVRSGMLTHDVMESHDVKVRVYGDAAVMTARGISGGTFQGHAFREVERVSCVFVRQEGKWRCVHTHLSRLAPDGAPGGV
jgi:ketosteroid isomerase-like protein